MVGLHQRGKRHSLLLQKIQQVGIGFTKPHFLPRNFRMPKEFGGSLEQPYGRAQEIMGTGKRMIIFVVDRLVRSRSPPYRAAGQRKVLFKAPKQIPRWMRMTFRSPIFRKQLAQSFFILYREHGDKRARMLRWRLRAPIGNTARIVSNCTATCSARFAPALLITRKSSARLPLPTRRDPQP